jgi:S1-C subfamily serine protease
LVDQIIETGEVNPGYLGISGGDVPPEAAEAFDVTQGAAIDEVVPGSPADEANLQPGDIVTELDGEEIESFAGLRSRILLHQPGDEVTITYERDGQREQATVTLGELPADVGGVPGQ